ncbi:MAG: helix-turn-helix transcriptional regulator [Burkholderiales bacterium]|nr:helix-turn-helix transcriptional regulator [Burkholderiales bacterium]
MPPTLITDTMSTTREPKTPPKKTRSRTQVGFDTDFFKALAEPVRQKIVMILLTQGRLNIQEISDQLVQDRSVVSRHLTTLKLAGFVKSYKVQRYTEYELDGQGVISKLERLLSQLKNCCPPPDKDSGCN